MSGTVDEFLDIKMKNGQLLGNALVKLGRVALRSTQTLNSKRKILVSWKTLNVGMRRIEFEGCRQQNLNFEVV